MRPSETATVLKGDIKALTGLRYIAAAAVVFHHIRPPKGTPEPIANIINHGFIGVPLFFMLSGLVLAWNYPRLVPKDGRRVAFFYVSRVARVMPLYWVMLGFLVVVREVKNVPQHNLWMHVLGIQTWSGDLGTTAYAYNAPAWSINVELFLYALFPFLIPLIARAARLGRPALLGIMALAMAVQWTLVWWFAHKGWAALPATDPSSGHRWLYRNPMTRVPDFVLGMCLAFLIREGRTMSRHVSTAVQVGVLVLVLAVATVTTGTESSGALSAAFYGAIWALPFSVLLYSLSVGQSGVPARVLSTGPMLTLGTASYALYMTHRPLQPGFFGDLVRGSGGVDSLALMFYVLLMASFLAEGVHRYLEGPVRTFVVTHARRIILPPPPAAPDPELTAADARAGGVEPAVTTT